ncbi:MAG: putative toxin-antitoxin system toxin component, PIN family [Actinomycetota bacterium]
MRAVIDTNVWVSGLILPGSLPGQILHAIRDGAVVPVVSWELADELVRVLRRPRLRHYHISEQDVRDVTALLAPFLPRADVQVEVAIRDPADEHVIVAAIAGGAETIVTGDRDLLDDKALAAWLRRRGVALLAPRELLRRIAR